MTSDRAPSPTPALAPVPQEEPETAPETQVPVKEESPTLPSPTTSFAEPSAPTSPSPSRQARRTPAQRRAYLRDHPLSGEVEPGRVFCRNCQKWIRLRLNFDYHLGNWQAHVQRCQSARRTPSKPNFSPKSRVATAERRIVLLNDPQVKFFSTQHVHCGTCKMGVALEGHIDYDLSKWTEHKEKCIPMTPAPITPKGSTPRAFPPASASSTHSQVSAGRSARSPTPVGEGAGSNSAETTAVAESSPATVKIGLKRVRDEETGGEGEGKEAKDERPTNRPRTETYEPPAKDAPSLFGWLMQPLREFARGFREGLSST